MLTNLQVRDFAIVDQIDVEFEAGMTVLTGETGAGKSILVDAIGLVLGERGNAQLVRDGAKRAEFTAEFDVSDMHAAKTWLEEQSLDVDDECLLRRIINADGRSRAFINGNSVPLSQLKSLGELLLDIHGQHFHQSIGHRSVQRELLDHFVIHFKCDLTHGHALDQFVDENACYLPYVIFLQVVEHDHIIQSVEKLRLEELFNLAQNQLTRFVIIRHGGLHESDRAFVR